MQDFCRQNQTQAYSDWQMAKESFKMVRIEPDNVKRIRDYRRADPYAPNIQRIVNFALQKFLESVTLTANNKGK